MGAFANWLAPFVCAAASAASSIAAASCLDLDRVDATPAAAGREVRPGVSGPTTRDHGRIVAPVTVNGQGPFRFLVDTGASRSALTPRLARRLNLASHGQGEVHSVHEVVIAPLVHVSSLAYGGLALTSGMVPVLEGAALADLDGLLGADTLRGRLFHVDFDRHCLEIAPARSARRLAGWTRLVGRMRFGHLIVIQGSIRGQPVHVLLDTGSDSTLASIGLRDRLSLRMHVDRDPRKQARAYTAGQPVVLDNAVLIPSLSLGDVEARDVVAYAGDFHIFRLWELHNEATVLIGMDVLSQARAMAIDYERGTVYFRLRSRGRRRAPA